MPDITMCNGTECPMKYECYRYLAEPNPYRQSYFMSAPCYMLSVDGSNEICCECFSPVRSGDVVKRED